MIQQSHFWVYIQRTESKPQRYFCTRVRSSIVHSSQKVAATQTPISRRGNKPKGAMHTMECDPALGGHSDTCSSMGAPRRPCGEEPVTKEHRHCFVCSQELAGTPWDLESEHGTMAARAGWVGVGLCNGETFKFAR